MRILVTNDDGIYSPGLAALAEAASKFGEVRLVAPDVEQSSMAQAITATRPLTHRRARVARPDGRSDERPNGRSDERFDAWRVNGTPSDCTALGAHVWGHVDVVFSGINLGLNVGNSMWHSGTLAAAKQAALLGLRGIAFSAPETGDTPDYEAIRPFLDRVIRQLLETPNLCLVNVNFPSRPRGIEVTKQSVRHYDGHIVPAKDPFDRDIYWFVGRPIEATEPGTDRWAVEHGLVSITPLRLDLTDHATIDQIAAHAAE